MAAIVQAGANQPLSFTVGDDVSLRLTVTENAVAYSWTGATVTTSIIAGAAVATNFTTATSTGGILDLSLTDTQTTTLGLGTFDYWVKVTKAGITSTWVAGQLTMHAAQYGSTSNLSSTLAITTAASTTLAITLSGYGAFLSSAVTALPAATAVTIDDLFIVVDDPAGTPASKNITANNAATSFMLMGGADATTTPTSPLYKRAIGDVTTTGAGVINWVHNGDYGYLIHLTTGANIAAPYACLAIGVDNAGNGMLVSNKSTGVGIAIAQNNTISSATAYALKVSQDSTTAPAVYLEQTRTSAKEALVVIQNGTAGTSQILMRFTAATGGLVAWGYDIGRVYADTGRFDWMKELRSNGSKVVALETDTALTGNVSQVAMSASGSSSFLTFSRYSGSAGLHYPWRIRTSGSTGLEFVTGSAAAIGSESFTLTALTMNTVSSAAGLGFFGTAAVAKPTGVAVSAAGIHAALVTLGLIAA